MITIVSGLPRSGTSLMMQMLAAGGLTLLTDGERAADASNPRGYFEWEKAKKLPTDPDSIAEAEGKVVKIISALLLSLPSQFSYKVIFMERALDEVAASQAAMIQKLGTERATLSPEVMARALESHLRQVKAALALRPETPVCWMEYSRLISETAAAAARIQRFLDVPLDLAAMSAQVDPSLYRQRHSPTASSHPTAG